MILFVIFTLLIIYTNDKYINCMREKELLLSFLSKTETSTIKSINQDELNYFRNIAKEKLKSQLHETPKN